MPTFETVPVYLRRYHLGEYEIRIHCRRDNLNLVQGWLYRNGDLEDTILTIDKGNAAKAKLADWFMRAAE